MIEIKSRATFTSSMSSTRDLGAGTYDSTHGFVMSGGVEDIASADKTTDGSSFEPFTPMPIGIDRHCLVALENGGDIFMTGGYSYEVSGSYSDRTYIFRSNSSTWESQPDMPTAREGNTIRQLYSATRTNYSLKKRCDVWACQKWCWISSF